MAMAEFESDAKAKMEEMAALLAEREEEFYAYQQTASDVRAAHQSTACNAPPCSLAIARVG